MGNITRWDIIWYNVPWKDDPTIAEKHPVLVINGKEAISLGYRMTSTIRNGELEYLIKDWVEAGLDRPTIIRIGKRVPIYNKNILSYIGKLSKRDIDAIKEIMSKYNLKYESLFSSSKTLNNTSSLYSNNISISTKNQLDEGIKETSIKKRSNYPYPLENIIYSPDDKKFWIYPQPVDDEFTFLENLDYYTKKVPIKNIVSNQYYIDDIKFKNIENIGLNNLPKPIAVEKDDKYYLFDGNHRTQLAIEQGNKEITLETYKFEDVEESYYDKLNELEKRNDLDEAYLDDEEEFIDYGTEEVIGKDIFDINKGESPYAREMIKLAKTGGVNEKGLGAEIIQMTPREYMEQVAKGFNSTFDKQIKQIEYDKKILDHLKQVLTKYKRKFPITYLNIDSKYGNFEQEGRHRMYTAGEMFGWDTKFPVLKIFEKDKDKAAEIKKQEFENKVLKYLRKAVNKSQQYSYKNVDEVKDQLTYDIERELDDIYEYKRLKFLEDPNRNTLLIVIDGEGWINLDLTEFDIDPNKPDPEPIGDYDLSDEELAELEKELGLKFDESLNEDSKPKYHKMIINPEDNPEAAEEITQALKGYKRETPCKRDFCIYI